MAEFTEPEQFFLQNSKCMIFYTEGKLCQKGEHVLVSIILTTIILLFSYYTNFNAAMIKSNTFNQ